MAGANYLGQGRKRAQGNCRPIPLHGPSASVRERAEMVDSDAGPD
jgi:hypothetical protein